MYIVKLIDSFLSDRRCIFDFDPFATYDIHVDCPQGSVLSPFLWAVLIDDALRFTVGPRQLTVGYADDISLVTASADPAVTMEELQLLCDRLVDWLRARKLEVCPTKSVDLTFSRRPAVLAQGRDLSLSFDGSLVSHTTSTRFL